jgi:glycosyltransferase involved in cell wall biosynthesis
MNLLILTHDPLETLDRRILNEARMFVEHGWTVQIILAALAPDATRCAIAPGVVAEPCPIHAIEAPYDPLFHDSQAAQMRDSVIRWFGRDTLVYRAARACHRSMRSVQTRLERGSAGASVGSPAWFEQQLSRSPRPQAGALIDQWLKHQKPRHIRAVEVLYRAARRLYLAGKSAAAMIGRPAVPTAASVHSRGAPSDSPAAPPANPSWYPLPFTHAFVKKARSVRADAILACDLPALPAAALLARVWDVPLIYDSHEFYTEQECFSPRQKWILEHHERLGLAEAKLCFVVSEQIGAAMRDKYGLAAPPTVLYNAPNFRRQADPTVRDAIRRSLGLRDHQRYVLYHGGIIAGRNLDRVVRCFCEIAPPDRVLVMLGYGPAYESFDAFAKASGGRVIVHPAVPQDDLVDWVSGAAACLIPYLTIDKAYEYALPNKLFDCIELSTPIIANERLVCIRELVDTYAIGCVGPMETDEQMRSTLTTGLSWTAARGDGSSAFQAARERYGWEAHRATFCRSMRDVGLEGF